MREIDNMMRIALVDAASNCAREGATAILTLRSGVQIMGRLEKTNDLTTAHIKPSEGNGWATVLIEEIAAVEARR